MFTCLARVVLQELEEGEDEYVHDVLYISMEFSKTFVYHISLLKLQ